jgi:pimeloyl-ACP methyl ester carboxylesterase
MQSLPEFFARSPDLAFAHQARSKGATLGLMLHRPPTDEELRAVQVAPPLLLLPGTLCDERVFRPAVDGFDRAIVTRPLTGATNTTAMADRLLDRAPDRFALCGFSLGAIVALEVIARAPERVERLCLIGGNARAMPTQQAAERRAAVVAGGKAYIDKVWAASVPFHRRNDAALRDALELMASVPPASFAEQIELSINRVDSRSRLHSIRVPTLVMVGAEDRICPPELSAEIAAEILDARLVVVERAGHYLTLDQPEIVRRELHDWLAMPTISEEPR